MSKNLVVIIVVLLLVSCNQPIERQNDFIVFKDGKKFPKTEFVKECISSGIKSGNDKIANMEGYCNCLIESIASRYTYSEIEPLLNSVGQSTSNVYNKAYDFMTFPGMAQIVNECIASNIIPDSKKKIEVTSDAQLTALALYLKNGLLQQEGFMEFQTLVDVDGYCECLVKALTKIYSANELYSDSEIANDPRTIRIQDSCVKMNLR